MGSNNAIGTGALILSANADRMVSGLDKAEAVATRKVAAINAKVNAADAGVAAKLGGKIEGKFGEAFQGAMFGSIGAMIAGVGKRVTESFIGMLNKSAQFRAEMERSVELSAEWSKSLDRATARGDERLDAIAPPADKLAATAKEIDLVTRELSGYRSATEATRKEIADLSSASSPDGWKLWLGGGLTDSIGEAGARLKDAEGAAAKASDRLAKLRDAKRRLEDPSSDMAFVGEIDKATAALEIQTGTWGKDAEAAALAGFKARGATDTMVAGFEAAAAKLRAARVGGEVKDATDALKIQVATWGKGSAEVTAYGLKVKGASDASVAGILAAGETLDKLGRIDAIERQGEKLKAYDASIGETTAALQKQQAVAAAERGRLADAGKEEDPEKKVRLIDEAADALKRAEAKTAALTERTDALKRARERAFRSDLDEKLKGDIDRGTNAIRDQVETWGLNARQADLFKLKARGASDEMLMGYAKQAVALDKLEQMQKESDFLSTHKAAGAFEKGSTAAYSVVTAHNVTGMIGEASQKEARQQVLEMQKLGVTMQQVRDLLKSIPKVGVI